MTKAKPKTEPKSEPKTKTKTKAKKAATEAAPPPAPAAKPVRKPAALGDDASLDAYTQGLTALQKKDYAKAAERFAAALEGSDRPEVRDRARQLLAASRQKAEEAAGKTGEAEDPYLLAVYEKNRGRYKEALELSRKGGRDQKDDRYAYLAASVHAIENRIEEAAQALAKAVELNPRNRIHAFHDPDFSELRKNRDHRPLFGLS